jgi:hypothetical protein
MIEDMVGCLMGLNSEVYNIRFELNSGLSYAYHMCTLLGE